VGKGTKGRYLELLEDMRLSAGGAATFRDFVAYGLSSGAGTDGFFEIFHALQDALYRPDFSDLEAEREFYHFAVASDPQGKKTLIEGGTVYDEMLARQDRYTYYYQLTKRVFGEKTPFAFESGGAPEEMRNVTPEEIRRFHEKWYRVGPGTGFIFSFPPQVKALDVLRRISQAMQAASPARQSAKGVPAGGGPKYVFHPSEELGPSIYPYPGANEAAPGTVDLAWKPATVGSLLQLKLLELFCRGLAEGEDSILQKVLVDSKTRVSDAGATAVECSFLSDSERRFPATSVEISGIPGNRITPESLEQLRKILVNTVKEVSQYPDHSPSLLDFNRTIASSAKGMRRSDEVWTKNPPEFQRNIPNAEWKRYFERLEMDPSFVRSLSQEQVWQSVDEQLASGKNIWRDLIHNLQLEETPYITAGVASPKLLEEVEKLRQERIRKKTSALLEHYATTDEQEALTKFEQEELAKSKEIDKIDAKVSHPTFTDHPPMVPDEDIRYKQFQIDGVPVIATLFDRPPTMDIGLSFDLSRIPSKYYKYLPLIPECLKSLGLKKGNQIVPYAELSNRIQRELYDFSTGYETNTVSHRADFTIRASATSLPEFRRALDLVRDAMESNYLELENAGRLRDILARRISADEEDARGDTAALFSADAFFNQKVPVYFALHSRFTTAHWDERLQWLLHDPLGAAAIEELGSFTKNVLATSACVSRQELSQKLNGLTPKGAERELLDYWKRNLYSFPEAELCGGLQQLTREVQEDLETGPAKTIQDLKELQATILNRRALHLDLTVSDSTLEETRRELAGFIQSIRAFAVEEPSEPGTFVSPVSIGLQRRYHVSSEQRPLFLSLINPALPGGVTMFYSKFPGYSQLERKELLRTVASKLFSGAGPHSFFVKTWAAGLAYSNGIGQYPAAKLIWYYAERSPDLPSLIKLVNSMASGTQELQDPRIVDYAMSGAFSFSRLTNSASARGRAMAHDLRDGNEPEKIRQFSEAILKLRQDHNLLRDLKDVTLTSICGVLLRDDCRKEQEAGESVFFFLGPEQIVSSAEKQIPIPSLLRLYTSDFWMK